MTESVFFRLLDSSIESKAKELHTQILGINTGNRLNKAFLSDTTKFFKLPGTTFAYWLNKRIFSIFMKAPSLESLEFHACSGTSTGNDFRFLRCIWEINPKLIGIKGGWVDFPKGGAFSPYYSDPHLLINWQSEGDLIRQRGYIRNASDYYRSGLTWSARTTSKLSVRPLPKGCVFSHKGPVILAANDDKKSLLSLLAIMNSSPFFNLVKVQLGAAAEAARSYEVGVIQQTPVPNGLGREEKMLIDFSFQAFGLARKSSVGNEISHIFCIPTLLYNRNLNDSLEGLLRTNASDNANQETQLEVVQRKIDAKVAELYGVPELGGTFDPESYNAEKKFLEDQNDEEDILLPENAAGLVANLLMWCLGVAFGRWDVRFALDPSKLPELPGPFDPLPVSSPGMLVGLDGLPFPPNSPIASYPISIAWDGVIVDDPSHPRDILASVRRVLQLLWEDKADDIETEAWQILSVNNLRDYFRDPIKGFFKFHIKRYSKSRRKAPIYWLLQSSQRNYAIWLYYHRLTPDTLFYAAREYVDPKLNLETSRLEELQSGLEALSGSQRTRRERQIADQANLVDEIKAFQKELDRVALLELKPDLNDGVILNIAPLHQLVPWKEASKYWRQLTRGKYEWSSIAQQLRQKGIVKGKS
jgi:hypothetical protein